MFSRDILYVSAEYDFKGHKINILSLRNKSFNQSSVRLLRDDFGGDMAGLGVALSHGVNLNRGRFGNFPRAL